ncbi:MAG TPA: SulP family inorganic anion transporter [Saprospiraceae bacterium]|nr:SulP family inorganic anion transporter [Saprospiraceae bacterium]
MKFFRHLKGDLFGGITAGIVALPLALAFGLSSGLGPDAGMYGAIFIAFFAALFGGTATQISGPTAPMTAVSMLVISGILTEYNGDLQEALPAILGVFFLTGIFLVIMGLIRLGEYIKYIPYPVVSGFMTAIGIIILITQLLPALGYYPSEDKQLVQQFMPQAEEVLLEKILREEAGEGILVLEDFKETIRRSENVAEKDILNEARILVEKQASGVWGAMRYFNRAIQNISWIELVLSGLTIFIIYGFKWITRSVPSTLVALLLVSGVAFSLKMKGLIDYRPIPEIPSGFPSFRYEIFTEFSIVEISPYIFSALTLALLGAIDSLLTSVVADNMTKTRHNPNRELVGQGIGNGVAALFGGIPGAGATIRTVVNIQAGGKTRLSGMIAGVLLLIVLLALGPIASQIPAAVLAGILITVGIGVMDYKGLRTVPNMPLNEIFVMFLVLMLAVFWNLVYAVGIGLIAASLVFMKRMGDLTADTSRVVSLSESTPVRIATREKINRIPEALREEVYVKVLGGPLFFGYTSDFRILSKQVPDTATHVVIDLSKTPYVDQSGLFTLVDVFQELRQAGVEILLVGVNQQPLLRMQEVDIVPDIVCEAHIFENFHDCVEFIEQNVEDVV